MDTLAAPPAVLYSLNRDHAAAPVALPRTPVLTGIAAADAACCRAFGERSRGDDHRDAIALVAQVRPGRDDPATRLR